jgi:hypothetical protein
MSDLSEEELVAALSYYAEQSDEPLVNVMFQGQKR